MYYFQIVSYKKERGEYYSYMYEPDTTLILIN
jgi:hypothetical protein